MKNFALLIFAVSFLSLNIVGCARPNYQDDVGAAPAACGLQGCFFREASVNMQIEWEKFPTEDEYGSFLMTFQQTNLKLNALPSFTPEVELWMPSMNHGSTPVTVANVTDKDGVALKGQYRATNVFFIMPGVWEIRVKLKSPDGRVLDQQIVVVTL